MTTPAPWASVVLLDDTHQLFGFATGVESVDEWFHVKALPEQNAGRVSTHVCLSSDDQIVAFFSLKHIIVNLEGASRQMRDTAEAATGGATTGLLLAQMGVHQDLQRAGVGKRVVGHVMAVAVDLHRQSAFRLLVVDAEHPRLVPYYEQFGFRPLVNDLRLVMKMSAVHKVVSAMR